MKRPRIRREFPPLIGTDQEYGDVVRLVNGFTDFPGESVLGSIPDLGTAGALTGRIAGAAAQELLAVGISVDFAPVSDVLPVDGESGIGDRSYGSDPQRDAALVSAAVSGYQDAGVAATLKHFPGLGRVPQDTHETLPTLDVSCSSWNSHEAVPLRAGIKAGVAMVMTGHVQLPAVGVEGIPASLSPTVVTDLLRGSGRDGCAGLGFGGVTVSDSLQMVPVANSYSSAQAAVLALQAGEDLLLMPVRPVDAAAGIVAAVKDGSLSRGGPRRRSHPGTGAPHRRGPHHPTAALSDQLPGPPSAGRRSAGRGRRSVGGFAASAAKLVRGPRWQAGAARVAPAPDPRGS